MMKKKVMPGIYIHHDLLMYFFKKICYTNIKTPRVHQEGLLEQL